MPHFNPLITSSTEMGHKEPMTINAFASSSKWYPVEDKVVKIKQEKIMPSSTHQVMQVLSNKQTD
jgi:hypothetical protein